MWEDGPAMQAKHYIIESPSNVNLFRNIPCPNRTYRELDYREALDREFAYLGFPPQALEWREIFPVECAAMGCPEVSSGQYRTFQLVNAEALGIDLDWVTIGPDTWMKRNGDLVCTGS